MDSHKKSDTSDRDQSFEFEAVHEQVVEALDVLGDDPTTIAPTDWDQPTQRFIYAMYHIHECDEDGRLIADTATVNQVYEARGWADIDSKRVRQLRRDQLIEDGYLLDRGVKTDYSGRGQQPRQFALSAAGVEAVEAGALSAVIASTERGIRTPIEGEVIRTTLQRLAQTIEELATDIEQVRTDLENDVGAVKTAHHEHDDRLETLETTLDQHRHTIRHNRKTIQQAQNLAEQVDSTITKLRADINDDILPQIKANVRFRRRYPDDAAEYNDRLAAAEAQIDELLAILAERFDGGRRFRGSAPFDRSQVDALAYDTQE